MGSFGFTVLFVPSNGPPRPPQRRNSPSEGCSFARAFNQPWSSVPARLCLEMCCVTQLLVLTVITARRGPSLPNNTLISEPLAFSFAGLPLAVALLPDQWLHCCLLHCLCRSLLLLQVANHWPGQHHPVLRIHLNHGSHILPILW